MLKVIGKGGFSKVYMVRKKDTGCIYAMKVMKKDQVTNDSKCKQIMNERSIMETISGHPFVIKLHYAFQSKENLHFIVDFCTGGEMFYHIQKNGKYPESLARFYFVEILLGLEYLHENNIVYRDLKPENVLIDIDGHIKLADFGLSKVFKQDEISYSFCGSPEYMCPEILKREGHNRVVDFYTLGAILFEMLTGLPPYYTNNKGEMTMRILESKLTFPSYMSPQCTNLIKRLLERNPNKRLGFNGGVEEIKEHEWLQDIDWKMFLSKKVTPLWKPRLDQSNFDPEYTELPLNFDEANFKRALQGDREFSFYYESPCQSMTVTENSIYASNPDLTGTNAELLLQSGSSKKLLEHFFMQQPYFFSNKQERKSIVLSPRDYENIFQQQRSIMEMNTEMAIRINQNLIRDESKINLEYNEESGFTNLRGFSFFGEGEDEIEIKRQLIKYTKLRNKLNKKLKKIQDEEGIIKERRLKDISLSTPSSGLSSALGIAGTQTPPVQDESSSNRNSFPSNKVSFQHASENHFGSPGKTTLNQPKFIDKKLKQQMIAGKLGGGSFTSDRQILFKSFQPEAEDASMSKKQELFRSNVEPSGGNLLNDESMKNGSSNDNESGVADEREMFIEDLSQISTAMQRQNLSKFQSAEEAYQEYVLHEKKSTLSVHQEEEEKDESPQSKQDPKNIKFILFQSQNVIKAKKKIGYKNEISDRVQKIVTNQRSRQKNYNDNYSHLSKDQSQSLSESANSTHGRISKVNAYQSIQQNSSSSQAMTNSRDQPTQITDKSLLEQQTTDYGGAKHTFDSNNKRTSEDQSFNNDHARKGSNINVSNSDDLDKTTSIIAQQQIENQRIISDQMTKRVVQSRTIASSSNKKPGTAKQIPSHSSALKSKFQNLEIDVLSPIDPLSKVPSGEENHTSNEPPIRQVPQTARAGMEGLFNFNFDTEEDKNEIFLKNTAGLASPSKQGKKISYHSKQVSVDFFKLDMNTKVDQLRVNIPGKVGSGVSTKLTPTAKTATSLGTSFGQQVIQRNKKKIQEAKESIDGSLNTNQGSQLSAKKDSLSLFAKGVSKVSNLKMAMKKGSIQTASTIGLPKHALGSQTIDDSLGNSIQNSLPSARGGLKSKPPIQFSQQKSIDVPSSQQLSKKITSGVLGKNQPATPATKGIQNSSQSGISQKLIGQTALSQPSSAKNSHSSKFQFPPSFGAQTTVESHFNPVKKAPAPKTSKQKVSAVPTKFAKPPQAIHTNRDHADAEGQQPKKISSGSDSDPKKLLIQPPKTMTHQSHAGKGFFS